ncbi:MAG: NTP transferase domain-containing protein [Gammaproteobacteria bacterium]
MQNPRADAGMGTSLAAGVSATAAAGGWLIALADMPWVCLETVRTLADRLRDGASLVAPVCGGRRGHPVGFAAHWRDQLTTLSGDAGARRLLAEHAAELVLEPTDDVGVLTDVDYPGDLACRR